jgi:hypothetical protein
MLPLETSVRQLKKLRAETKGTDIGDLTAGDRLNHNVPNLQYIGNPVDTGIESWQEFSQKDSKLQTIAFKSKLVNKSIVKENKKENMKEKLNNVLKFNDFEQNWTPEAAPKTKRTDVAKDVIKETVVENDNSDEVKKFESFKLKEVTVKKEKQPEYTILGEEKELKSNPNFGVAAVKDQENKKIAFFNNFVVDPPTPRERPIGGYVGQYVDNGKVRGHINKIEGSKVFVESLDEPMKMVELKLKDVIKSTKKD